MCFGRAVLSAQPPAMLLESHSQHKGDLGASCWNSSSLHIPTIFSELGQLSSSAKWEYSYIHFGYWRYY